MLELVIGKNLQIHSHWIWIEQATSNTFPNINIHRKSVKACCGSCSTLIQNGLHKRGFTGTLQDTQASIIKKNDREEKIASQCIQDT